MKTLPCGCTELELCPDHRIEESVRLAEKAFAVNANKNLAVPPGLVPKDNSLGVAPSFTPGPWQATCEHHGRIVDPSTENNGFVVRASGVQIADVNHQWRDTGEPFWPDKPNGATRKEIKTDEAAANAQLIAAAPDLYAAAANALAILRGSDREHALIRVDGDQTTVSDMLRTALALAKGGVK